MKNNGWIKVDDELPGEWESVLFFFHAGESGSGIAIGWHTGPPGYEWHQDTGQVAVLSTGKYSVFTQVPNVTHWRPLPREPKYKGPGK